MPRRGGVKRGIPTTHGGVRFRSKLEARWARLFDAIETPWQYEPRRFPLGDRSSYTPDFYLPDVEFWLEVKPLLETDELSAVTERLEGFVAEHRVPLALLCGFGNGSDARFFRPSLREHYHLHIMPRSVAVKNPFLVWSRCPDCRRAILESIDFLRLAEIEGSPQCWRCGSKFKLDSLHNTFGDVAAFGVA